MNNYRQGEITPTMLAYMAGFFDAEGCVRILQHYHILAKKGKCDYYILSCDVAQKFSGILELFCKYFGGGIKKSKNACHHWVIHSADALKFLQAIEPYLIGKKEQVQVAINYQEEQINRNSGRNHPLTDKDTTFNKSQYLLLRKLKDKELRQMPLIEIHPIEQMYSYLAGFFDGEGYIGIHTENHRNGHHPYYRLVVSVSQTYKTSVILDLYRYYFGGTICDTAHKHRIKAYMWQISSRLTKKVLAALLPYLRVKKAQAQLGLGFQEGVHARKYKDKCVTEKELAIREVQRIMMHDLKKVDLS